jgi:uncharacterized protein (TIGR03790 family)
MFPAKYFTKKYYLGKYFPPNTQGIVVPSVINLTKDNVLFIYNTNSVDSYNVALHYQNIHKLNDDQLISINCSNTEILLDYSHFQSEVENPIKTAINNSNYNIYIIVLGYNVPGGFYDNIDIISSTSRISRIFQTYSKKKANPLYNRQISRRYLTTDYPKVIIASRIDAPTVDDAKNMIGYSKEYTDQHYVNGRFYFDPFSDISGYNSDEYSVDLLSFYNNLLFDLSLEVSSTVFQDTYIDVVTPYLKHDSIYWGWLTDRSDITFFKNTDTSRVFFYNADFDSSFTVRNTLIGNFSPLAIKSGYISLSGSMSYPGFDSFLRPTPFFESINDGATLGEAFLFACPFLDWTIALFGDPLIRINFPVNSNIANSSVLKDISLDNKEDAWLQMSIILAKAMARYINSEYSAFNIRQTIIDSVDVMEEVNLLYQSHNLVLDTNESVRTTTFSKLCSLLFSLLKNEIMPQSEIVNNIKFIDINSYFEYKNYKISKLLSDICYLSQSVSNVSNVDNSFFGVFGIQDKYLYDEGYWEFLTLIINEIEDQEYYHFEMDISDKNDFSNILLSLDSSVNQSNWFYEYKTNEYKSLPSSGISSAYAGFNIKYISKMSEYLQRGIVYYYRIRQKTNSIKYSYIISEQVIYT